MARLVAPVRWIVRSRRRSTLLVLVLALAAGGVLWVVGLPRPAHWVWALATLGALIPLVAGVVRELVARRVGVDVIALLAMAGSLLLGEDLAGVVIAVMLTGGGALEEYADDRARRELRALVRRMPRAAHRVDGSGIADIDVDEVVPGDVLLVKGGEAVPVDGVLLEPAVLNESALTGEARPVPRPVDDDVRSGAISAAGAFRMLAREAAARSTYATIVRLTQEAAAARPRMVRAADRLAIVFLPLTLAVGAAAWVISGDPTRALAVLVVATPCPLILAAPIAVVAGMSRAASRGIIIKGGAALEALASARTVIFDKTGTLTEGRPAVSRVFALGAESEGELLRFAAALDLSSVHPLAAAIVGAARARGLSLPPATAVEEVAGCGISGTVEGRRIALGKRSWVAGTSSAAGLSRLRSRLVAEGGIQVSISIDGVLKGVFALADPIRSDAPHAFRALRDEGVRRILVLTGDSSAVALRVGRIVGADQVLADQTPQDKLTAVRLEREAGPTVMVGDGINDAPALAAADAGVAMGSRGETASSEAAAIVITVDRVDRVAEALSLSRRTRRIAMQSMTVGMGLSLAAMAVAAAGMLIPVEGAVLQELIDVLVIVNALRAVRGTPRPYDPALIERTVAEHHRIRSGLELMLDVADRLDEMDRPTVRRHLHELDDFLSTTLLPHETNEERQLLPAVDRVIGGRGPTEVTTRAHLDIESRVLSLHDLIQALAPDGPDAGERGDLRRALYELHAVLELHTTQEDQSYLPLLSG